MLMFYAAPRAPEAGPGKNDHGGLSPADLQGRFPDALKGTAAKLLNGQWNIKFSILQLNCD